MARDERQGRVAIIVTEKGIARVQLGAATPDAERASLRLYHRVKPVLDTLDRQASGSARPGAGKDRAGRA